MENIVELHHVEKSYPGAVETQVLFDVDLKIGAGSFNSIVGTSGSGKSTLLNILGTLDTPTRGEVFIDGIKTDRMNRNKLAELRNRTIGFVFQFHHLMPEFTALENVLIPYLIQHSRPSREILARANELFELLGIAHVRDNPSTRMSGGQQQRTAVARALINNPKIVFADEPTASLDESSSKVVLELFRRLNHEKGQTIVMVTHEPDDRKYVDRVIWMQDGLVKSDGLGGEIEDLSESEGLVTA